MPTRRGILDYWPFVSKVRWLQVSLLLLVSIPLSAGTFGSSSILSITGYDKIAKRRVTGDTCEIDYRARLGNRGPAVAGAVARIVDAPWHKKVLDGTVTFGPVAARGKAVSLDTLTIRQSCYSHRDHDSLDGLRWEIKALEPSIQDLTPSHLTLASRGGRGTLTVTLRQRAIERTPIAIFSANPFVVAVPHYVVVDAGQLSTSFTVIGGAAGGQVRVKAILNHTTASAYVTVRDRPSPPVLSQPLVEGATHISGTGIGQASVDVRVDNVLVASQIVQPDGRFDVIVGALAAGQVVQATQTLFGLVSKPSAPVTVLARPPAPTIAAPLLAGGTVVRGSGVPSATIVISIDGVQNGVTIVGSNGTFEASVPTLIAGQQVHATQTIANITSIPSATITVVGVPPRPSVASPIVEGAENIGGTGLAGATVEAFVDDAPIGTAAVGDAGTWTLAIAPPLVAGQRVTARQSVAGIPSVLSTPVVVMARPPAPVVTAPLVAGATTISGTASPESSVSVFVNGASLGATETSEVGTWSLTAEEPLVAGQQVWATQTVAGIESRRSAIVTVLARPPAPIVNGPLVAGDTLVTGTGSAGATLTLLIEGVEAASVTVADDGTWSASLEAALVAGQSVSAHQRVAEITSEPSAPLIVLARPPAPVVRSPIFADAATVAGTGVAGASVQVFVDDVASGTTAVGADGLWALPLARPLVAGEVITAVQVVAGVPSVRSDAVIVEGGSLNRPPIARDDAYVVAGRDNDIVLPDGFRARTLVRGALFDRISALAFDPAGQLYVADNYERPAGRISKIQLATSTIQTLHNSTAFRQGDQILIGDGRPLVGYDLVLSDHNTVENGPCCDGRVFRVNRSTGALSVLATGAGNTGRPAGDPFGLALGPGGAFGAHLYVMDFQGNSTESPVLYRVAADGSTAEFASNPSIWTTSQSPQFLAFANGNGFGADLYVSDRALGLGGGPDGIPTIWRVAPNGSIAPFLQGPAVGRPANARFAPGGAFGTALYFVDISNPSSAAIKRAMPDGTVDVFASNLPGDWFQRDPGDFVFTSDGHALYLASGNTILEITGASESASFRLLVPAPGVLSNDSDADGDPLTSTLAGSATNGAVSLSSNGSFVYEPSPGFEGSDAFTYAARDAVLASDPATVTIAVLPPIVTNQPPFVAAGPDRTLTVSQAASLEGSVNDDGLPLGGALSSTWTVVDGPGAVTFGDATTPSTTAAFTVPGVYVLRLTAADGVLQSRADVTIRVNESATSLFVSARGSAQGILQFDAATGSYVRAFVPSGSGGMTAPDGMVFGPDGYFYAVANDFGRNIGYINRFDARTGAFIDTAITATDAGFTDFIFGANGHVFASYWAGRGAGVVGPERGVREYDPSTGAFIRLFANTGARGLSGCCPQQITFGPDGHLYVTTEYSLMKFDGATGAFIYEAPARFADGVTFGADGTLYVSTSGPEPDDRGGDIAVHDPATGARLRTFVPVGSGGLGYAHSIRFGLDGHLYAADTAGSQILRYDGATGAFLDVFVAAGVGGLSQPINLIFGPSGSPGAPGIVSVAPNAGRQGEQHLEVAITGQLTHFLEGSTQVSFGPGITVTGVSVLDGTRLSANVGIASDAALGGRVVTVTTGDETVSLSDGFSVLAVVPPNQAPIVDAGADQHVTLPQRPLPTSYSLAFLPGLAPGATIASDINDVGEVVGSATNAQGWFRPVVWSAAGVSELAPSGGQNGRAMAINIAGLIGGQAQRADGGWRNIFYHAGTLTDFSKAFDTSCCTWNMGMNRFGDLVGHSDFRPIVFRNGQMSFLPIPPGGGGGGHAIEISDRGVIVGNAIVANNQLAAQWTNGQVQLLPALDGTSLSTAYGVNELDERVGSARIGGQDRGVLWRDGAISDIGPVSAVAINDRRDVLLSNAIWRNGVSVDLRPFIAPHNPNFNLTKVNNRGQIIGYTGVNSLEPAPRAFILNPQQGAAAQIILSLSGTASDDNLPGPALQYAWSQISGPAAVSFDHPASAATAATFTIAGTYVLRLTVSDSLASTSDDLTITVATNPAENEAPVVNAGTDQRVTFPEGAQLAGSATDDGIPIDGVLTYKWWKLGGPGAVTFSTSDSALATATFSIGGTYVLRLVVNDGMLSNADDITVVVEGGAPPTPTLTLVQPTSSRQGQSGSITLGGANTHFVQGSTTADFGAGITVSGATVSCATCLSVQIAIADDATPGPRDVTVTTGAEIVTLPNGFTVLPGIPRLVAAAPGSARQGETFTISLTGQFTHFAQGTTQVALGPGLTTTAVTVTSPTTLTAGLTVSANAAVGARTLVVSTGSELLTAADAFTVFAGEPAIVSVAPATGRQGQQNLNVAIAGQFTHFTQGLSQVFFASAAVTVNRVTVLSATQMIANVSIALNASLVPRAVTVTTGAEVVSMPGAFTVTPAVNQAPTITIAPTWSVMLPNRLSLTYAVADDSLPLGGALTVSWEGVSGPGGLGFINQTPTSISAGFDRPGIYVLRITASDTQFTVSSDVTVTVLDAPSQTPNATIVSPAEGAEITGRTSVIGSVGGPALASWTLELRAQGETAFRTLATGVTPVDNATLGTLDPTLLLNGIVELRLRATDVAGQTSVAGPISVVVTQNQKVGNFTVSFNDLTVPVAGLPIQVIRTYDSRDKRVGDFGVGWRLGLSVVTITTNGPLGDNWLGTSSGGVLPNLCIAPARAHLVTITFVDGTVFQFQPTLTPGCQQLVPLSQTTVSFTPISTTPRNASLAIVGSADPLVAGNFPGTVTLLDLESASTLDPVLYRLTMPDGRVMLISRQSGLQSMTDLSGNTLVVTATGVTHSSGRSITLQRDSLNRIARITDPNGNALLYGYDAAGDLVSFTDAATNVTTFAYNGSHGLLTIQDPRGIQPVRNVYDDDGRLIQHVDAFGHTIDYTHDLNARQEIVTDRLGGLTVNEYDERGNVIRVTDAVGGVTTRTYDARNNVSSEIDPLGRQRTYTYDANDNRLTETDPLGHTTTYAYNGRNQVVTVRDALGRLTTNVYDASGNLTSSSIPSGTTTYTYNARGLRTSMTDALMRTTTYAYDGAGNLTAQTDPLGRTATYTYDANGNRLTESRTQTIDGGAQTALTRYEYDALNRVTRTTFPDATTTRIAYNVIGKEASTIDQLGRQTTYAYDLMGRPTTTTFPDNTTESSTYDAEGRRTRTIDRSGHATDFSYDALGRLTTTTFADDTTTATAYDAAGQVVRTTGARGHATTFAYDAAGQRTRVTNALNQAVVFAYDDVGNQTAVTDANNHTTQYQYDSRNRRTRTTYADGTFEVVAYDALGRTTSKTDQAGRVTQFEYDAIGRLTAVVDALNQRTTYAYDEVGNRTSQTDANSHTTGFGYDLMGRRIRRTLPLGMAETFAYDAAGNLAAKTDFNGRTTTYAYDVVNRLVRKTPDPILVQPQVQFAYDANGQRTQMIDASGTTSYAYDVRHRLVTKATPQGTLTYAYDAAGNLASIRSSNSGGTSLDYTYDVVNRLSTAADTSGAPAATTYAYDLAGNLDGYLYPNGVRHSFVYNALNRLTTLTVAGGASTLASYAYSLGPTGNRTSVTELHGRRVDYLYDALYRLRSEAISGAPEAGTTTYAYDPVGNRLARSSPTTGLTMYSYDANDRLTSDSYDKNGNTTASGASAYSYDFENHLTGQNGGSVTIVYDGDGNRVRKTVGGVTTRYLVDDRNLTGYVQVLEEIVDGGVRRKYTYGLHRLSQHEASGVSFYGYDGHGSVRQLFDAIGNVTPEGPSDAYGIPSHPASSNAVFAGEQFDSVLDAYYLRARYYNPRQGRFFTADSFEGFSFEPLSLHLYSYTLNDPVNRVDPTGHISLAEVSASVGLWGIINQLYFPTFVPAAIIVRNTLELYEPGFDARSRALEMMAIGGDDPSIVAEATELFERGNNLVAIGSGVIRSAKVVVDAAEALGSIAKSITKLTADRNILRPIGDSTLFGLRSLQIADSVQSLLLSKTNELNLSVGELQNAIRMSQGQTPVAVTSVARNSFQVYLARQRPLLKLVVQLLGSARTSPREEALRRIEMALRSYGPSL